MIKTKRVGNQVYEIDPKSGLNGYITKNSTGWLLHAGPADDYINDTWVDTFSSKKEIIDFLQDADVKWLKANGLIENRKLKTFTQHLKEAAEAVCQSKFEKFLFGDFTKSKESDTPDEAAIFKKLKRFISANRIAPELKNDLNDLDKCTQYFKKILQPDATIAYRATALPLDDLINLKYTKAPGGYYTATLKYNSRRPIQSWTKSFKFAQKWAKKPAPVVGKLFSTVIEAKVDKTFIFNSGFLDKIDDSVGIDIESEIIRVSDASIKVLVYMKTSEYNKLMKNLVK